MEQDTTNTMKNKNYCVGVGMNYVRVMYTIRMVPKVPCWGTRANTQPIYISHNTYESELHVLLKCPYMSGFDYLVCT